jgi:serine/threonine protein kinase
MYISSEDNVIYYLNMTLDKQESDRKAGLEQPLFSAAHEYESLSGERVHIVWSDESTSAERFGEEYPGGGREEFEALQRLYGVDPEHIARPIELLEEDGRIGYKMEYIDGTNVFEYLMTYRDQSQIILDQLHTTLIALHESGLAHGDLAGNTLITNEGVVKLIDPVGFGVSDDGLTRKFQELDLAAFNILKKVVKERIQIS